MIRADWVRLQMQVTARSRFGWPVRRSLVRVADALNIAAPIKQFPSTNTSQRASETMANKEATVYILDLGQSMGEKRHGRTKTNLEWAMEYVWDKITTTVCWTLYPCRHSIDKAQVSSGRKTALMSVVGYRTDGKYQLHTTSF